MTLIEAHYSEAGITVNQRPVISGMDAWFYGKN